MRSRLRRYGIVAALTAVSLARMPAAWADEGAGGHPAVVTPAALVEMLKTKDFFLVNVSSDYAGEISRTDAVIPYDQTSARISEYPRDKGAKIVVYCMTGKTSVLAMDALRRAGYTNVSMLEGGLRAWEKARYIIIRRNASPSIPYPGAAKDSSRVVPQPCPCGLY